jgi:hypothetical protein
VKRAYTARPKIKLKKPSKCNYCGKALSRGEFAYDHGNDVFDSTVCVQCNRDPADLQAPPGQRGEG